jgi:hypothetical protein
MGTSWDGCLRRMQELGVPVETPDAQYSAKLLALAWQNFANDPAIALKRIGAGITEFSVGLPDVVWRGLYNSVVEPY